jgi:hypothetical protein
MQYSVFPKYIVLNMFVIITFLSEYLITNFYKLEQLYIYVYIYGRSRFIGFFVMADGRRQSDWYYLYRRRETGVPVLVLPVVPVVPVILLVGCATGSTGTYKCYSQYRFCGEAIVFEF